MKRLIILWIGVVTAAAAKEPTGIGAVANNLLEPVAYLSDFIYTACFLLGGSFIFAGVVKYLIYRKNPLAVTISTVVFLLVAGVFLLALPFANVIVQHGSAYSLLK